MHITEALLAICLIFRSSKALTTPLTNAINQPSISIPSSSHHVNTTAIYPDPPLPWPWPPLNTPISLNAGSHLPAAFEFTSYGPKFPERYTEPTLAALDYFWAQFSPYFPYRSVGDPPETLVYGDVTLHVVAFDDWHLGSYKVDDLMDKMIKYVQSNKGARDVSGVIGPVDDEGKWMTKAAFKIVID